MVAQIIKNLPAMQKTWVSSLGWEVLMEKGRATHSSILAWRIPSAQRGLAGCSPWGRKELDTAKQLNHHHHHLFGASLVAQMVKNLPAMQKTWV